MGSVDGYKGSFMESEVSICHKGIILFGEGMSAVWASQDEGLYGTGGGKEGRKGNSIRCGNM